MNSPIFDREGHLLGIADLLEPTSGTVTEYDGSSHRAAVAHAEDNDREERFERHSLTVVRVSDLDAPGVSCRNVTVGARAGGRAPGHSSPARMRRILRSRST